MQVDSLIGLQAARARRRVGLETTDVGDDARLAVAADYDAYERSAFSLAVAILGDQRAAESAVLEAFGGVRQEPTLSDETDGEVRARLLQDVYRSASAVEGMRLPHRLGARPKALRARTPVERESLLQCLHGVNCVELASIRGVSLGTIDARLRRAFVRIQEADRVADGESSPARANPHPFLANPLARGRRS